MLRVSGPLYKDVLLTIMDVILKKHILNLFTVQTSNIFHFFDHTFFVICKAHAIERVTRIEQD